MIRSGLVKHRHGGGFEEGYPHERAPRNVSHFINPHVVRDGVIRPRDADITQIVPNRVRYKDLFARTMTPDERAYVAQKVKRVGKLQKPKKKNGFELPDIEAPPLPAKTLTSDERAKAALFEEKITKYEADRAAAENARAAMQGVEEVVVDPENTVMENASGFGNTLADQLRGVEVVQPPPNRITAAEAGLNQADWEAMAVDGPADNGEDIEDDAKAISTVVTTYGTIRYAESPNGFTKSTTPSSKKSFENPYPYQDQDPSAGNGSGAIQQPEDDYL